MRRKTPQYSLFLLPLLSSLLISSCVNKRPPDMTVQEPQISLTVSSREAFDLIERNAHNKDFTVLDVRTPQEYNSGHIAKAIMVDFNSETFGVELRRLDKDKTYLIYCRSGNRSGKALLQMKEMGFMRVYEISGGIIEWNNNKFPVVNE